MQQINEKLERHRKEKEIESLEERYKGINIMHIKYEQFIKYFS